MSTVTEVASSLGYAKGAIDMHCHGIGRFDFTEIADIELQEIENILSARNHRTILTLYLPQAHFDDFLRLISAYDRGRQLGRYQHIVGIGLEGPLLASHGGTPQQGVWNPTRRQWRQLAECGKKGLIYSIFSPDAKLGASGSGLDAPAPNVRWIAETLLEGGVLPAAGHFSKEDPLRISMALQSIYDAVKEWGKCHTLTDHLYNDMPHNFKHAWRTKEEKLRRDDEFKKINIESWTLGNIEEKLGVVPATMIRNAKKGLVKIAMNFDGEHVDLAVAKKTVELVGAENMLMMTDSIESKRLAGRDLSMHEGSTLLYQSEDIVAAGSQGVLVQIKNMIHIGLTPREIKLITQDVPALLLQKRIEACHVATATTCV